METVHDQVEWDAPSTTYRRGVLIAGLIIAMLFGALDQTIVGTAMPRIVGELGGLSLLTWVTTAYMLTATTVVPITGKLADLMGRKVVYVAGLGIFVIGSALCGAAQNMIELILFRGFQGIGGGMMMPMAMIIIGDLFEGKQRAKWQGVFGAIFGLSSVIGPQLGGWLVDALNWRWVFYINLPIGILAAVLIAIGLKGHRSPTSVRLDWAGMSTMVLGVVSLLLALSLGGKEYEWTSWQILGLFALGLISLILFALVESRATEPIFPIRLFRNRTFTIVNSIGFLMSVGMFGSIMFVPLFMQGVTGVSASSSGTVMTPMMITMIVGSVLGGQLVYKIGMRVQMVLGMLIMVGGFGLLSTMDIHTSALTASIYMVVLGLGMGLVLPLLTLALQESFPRSERGVVTSSSQFFRQIGGTFGMTVLGAVMNARSSETLNEKMAPLLQHLPGEMASRLSSMIHGDAQGLYNSLLNPAMLTKLPPTFVDVLKTSLVDSLHSVFLFGLIFVLLGAVCTLFMGRIQISERKPEQAQAE
ncbi:MDR family MFS transporter [Polycladomyces subterraneus]|uniref:MFS transporter n=1 Tax=Polycladomyces subterraneus TaxID=1016997 RepID=A0ABT8IPC7_9BACL|nr:MDR family MFS transporter [Polycladomyces subterraneus]MDN4594653.1 MFS transporter [Polycladomyces subterraneus]